MLMGSLVRRLISLHADRRAIRGGACGNAEMVAAAVRLSNPFVRSAVTASDSWSTPFLFIPRIVRTTCGVAPRAVL